MESENSGAKASLASFFLFAFSFTWGFWLVAVLNSASIITLPIPNLVLVGIGAHGPLVAPLVLTYRSGGRQAVTQLLRSGFNLRLRPVWWALIIIGPAALAGVAVWLSRSFHDYQPDLPLIEEPWLIPLIFLFMLFLGGSVQEEFGWRGFALPRLLEIQTPFLASLVLGVIWGVWHLPLVFISGVSQEYMSFAVFLPLTLAFSFIFTWVYLRTNLNLFSALLLHTTINTSLNLFPTVELEAGGERSAMAYLLLLYALAAVIVVVCERALFFTMHEKQTR
jgi:uncharacterized protein